MTEQQATPEAASSSHWRLLCVASCLLALVGGGASCRCAAEKECVDESKPALADCQAKTDKMQTEIISLKRLLAHALANPGTIKVDPSVLVIDGQRAEAKLQEGTLSQEQVVATMKQNTGVLKSCYERAMKSNTSLHRQTITLSIGFKVKPNGNASDVVIRPNYDSTMLDCMKKAILRWRFPPFSGQPVEVESPLTLTPKL